MKALIITEANPIVASGHLMESVALAGKIQKEGHEVLLAVNEDLCQEWRKALGNLPIFWYKKNLDHGMEEIRSCLHREAVDVIITDLRQLMEDQVKKLRDGFLGKIICLDEWGRRELSCDVIVNNMASSYFWEYPSTGAELFCGPQYLMLKESLRSYHQKEKKNGAGIEKVVITMGGVDKMNHTQEILKQVTRISQIRRFDVVLGGGYVWDEQIRRTFEADERVCFHKNIDYLFRLFAEDDLGFSAGGNTLYEMAAVGLPSIVVPTMEHERINGEAFASMGYGILCREEELSELQNLVTSLSYEARIRMSETGKGLVDGRGVERIWKIIEQCTA